MTHETPTGVAISCPLIGPPFPLQQIAPTLTLAALYPSSGGFTHFTTEEGLSGSGAKSQVWAKKRFQ
jgi:hypothetical protein